MYCGLCSEQDPKEGEEIEESNRFSCALMDVGYQVELWTSEWKLMRVLMFGSLCLSIQVGISDLLSFHFISFSFLILFGQLECYIMNHKWMEDQHRHKQQQDKESEKNYCTVVTILLKYTLRTTKALRTRLKDNTIEK